MPKGYRTLGRIGQGQFGHVDAVQDQASGQVYALKTISKDKVLRSRGAIDINLEKRIHLNATLHSLKSAFSSPPVPLLHESSQSPSDLHLLLTYYPSGSLWDRISSEDPITDTTNSLPSFMAPLPLHSLSLESLPLPLPEILHYSYQLILALSYLHETQSIAHRDIKPQNVLLDGVTGRVVLTDFGSAGRLLPVEGRARERSGRGEGREGEGKGKGEGYERLAPRYLPASACLVPCGTPDYLAPEVLEYWEGVMEKEVVEGEDSVGRVGEGDEAEEDGMRRNSRGRTPDLTLKPKTHIDTPDPSRTSMKASSSSSSTPKSKSKSIPPPQSTTDRSKTPDPEPEQGYDASIDYWSLGAMIYELVYGVPPFYAKRVEDTYKRIIGHEKYLMFPEWRQDVDDDIKGFLKGLLSGAPERLGRYGAGEVKDAAVFRDTEWEKLDFSVRPAWLDPLPCLDLDDLCDSFAQSADNSFSSSSSFLGWNPSTSVEVDASNDSGLWKEWDWKAPDQTQRQASSLPNASAVPQSFRGPTQPPSDLNAYMTPARPGISGSAPATIMLYPPDTILKAGPRSVSHRRGMGDSAAFRKMLDCVLSSAKKKVEKRGSSVKKVVQRSDQLLLAASLRQKPEMTLLERLQRAAGANAVALERSTKPPTDAPHPINSSLMQSFTAGLQEVSRNNSNIGYTGEPNKQKTTDLAQFDDLQQRCAKLQNNIERIDRDFQIIKEQSLKVFA